MNKSNASYCITVSGSGDAGFLQYWNCDIFACDCSVIKSKNENLFLTKFIYYYLKNNQSWFLSLAKGGIVKHVHIKDYENYRIPILSIETQQKIVTILDSFTELTTELTKRKEQFRFYINHFYNFNDTKEKRLFLNICDFIRGITYKKNKELKEPLPNSYILLRSNNISNELEDITNLDDVKWLNKNDININEKQVLKNDDVLMCIANGSKEQVGKVAHIKTNLNNTICGSFMSIIRPKTDSVLSSYVYFFLKSDFFREFLISKISLSTINNINLNIISDLSIPIVNKQEQNRISNFLELLSEYSENLKKYLNLEIALRQKQYEYYRNKLLTFKELKK